MFSLMPLINELASARDRVSEKLVRSDVTQVDPQAFTADGSNDELENLANLSWQPRDAADVGLHGREYTRDDDDCDERSPTPVAMRVMQHSGVQSSGRRVSEASEHSRNYPAQADRQIPMAVAHSDEASNPSYLSLIHI